DLHLALHDLGDGRGHALVEPGGLPALLLGEHQLDHVVRSRQAPSMGRQNPLRAALHRFLLWRRSAVVRTILSSSGAELAEVVTMRYRADQVGSLLRPPQLIEARTAYMEGRLDQDALRAVEDQA